MFSLEFFFSVLLNLNEKRGIFITKSIGINTEIIDKNIMSENIGNCSKLIFGIAAINIANAGTGSPINEVVCLLSILKLANLYAEKIGIRSANVAGKKNTSLLIE
jgi:hypothetical protein